jgi:hypothetical protein
MATAVSSASPGAKPAARAPRPSPAALPGPSSRASASGRIRASLHLSAAAGNGTGIHVPPAIAPLALPKMAGSRGTQKNILLFYCEEMRELAEQVVARNDDIELRSISWRSPTHRPSRFTLSFFRCSMLSFWIAPGLISRTHAENIQLVANLLPYKPPIGGCAAESK